MRSSLRFLAITLYPTVCGLTVCGLTACGSDGASELADDGSVPLDHDGAIRSGDSSAPDRATRDGGGETINRTDAAVFVPPDVCGNGVVAAPEECDDGNRLSDDGCDATCHRESGFHCPATGGACAPICGDGLLVAGEQCDDGGTKSGDGCSATCQLELGWSCLMSGASCTAAECGDGVIAGTEACDDGNQAPGDGCSVTCAVEPGWVCPAQDAPCTAAACGDGIRAGIEACDDGNDVSGDGCTAACDSVEPNYACPDRGGACIRTSVCGNGILTSDEQCDDRNLVSGDGCSSTCLIEFGWACPNVGRACGAAACGDGFLAGNEQCEDGNAVAGDGCFNCQVESGWACTYVAPVSTCHKAVCGDGKVEGNETCDDGNNIVGDGCGPSCVVEPSCAVGKPCVSSCGDGIRLPSDVNEQCDDGNLRGGDGCSSTCQIEPGFSCTDVSSSLPATLPLTVVYRDFIRAPLNGATKHPDFETFGGSAASLGLVGTKLVGGKPSYTGICEQGTTLAASCQGPQTTSAANFNQWYSNVEIPNVMKKFVMTLDMARNGTTTAYRNPSFGQQLFPLDTLGWVATTPVPLEAPYNGHNFGFTTEIHYWFQFKGGEVLNFSGDDDVWVFVAGELALDLGGLHSKLNRTITLDNTGNVACYQGTDTTAPSCGTTALGLVAGDVYEIALYHAERHTVESNFDLTLTGFNAPHSVCASQCGDGIVTSDEACDDGSACQGGSSAGLSCTAAAGCPGGTCVSKNDGSYGHCNSTCTDFGPHCGDGTVQTGEQCDSGFAKDLGGYNGCTAECTFGPRCGDGNVDGYYGEQCDLGSARNVGGYDGCDATCHFAERCGDGIVQSPPEACDDGKNHSAYNGCGPGCKLASFCGDGVIDRAHGEQCDNGTALDDGRYGGCTTACTLGPYCGDGILDLADGEQCDDGNLNDYDGCSPTCQDGIIGI